MNKEYLRGNVGCFQVDPGVLLLRSNRSLNHWSFREQATKEPAVLLEVTDGGTKKQVSLLRRSCFPELFESYCASTK